MKLLIQSDDYGMTPAVADGIIYGITHGVVRNTGLFSNMPWAAECVEKNLYAIQFHPEVLHTQEGTKMLHNFVRGSLMCVQ